MIMSKWVYVQQGYNNKGNFYKKEDYDKMVSDPDYKKTDDWYASTYYYEDTDLIEYKKNNSLTGLKSLKTDKLWFDFDDLENPTNAQNDTIELVSRLKKAGVKSNSIDVYFSGQKGFTVIATFDKMLNRTQVEHLSISVFGKGLETLDKKIY